MQIRATRIFAVGNAKAASVATAFSPLSLFAAGEQGFWYDPSDFSTLFQDAAGTTPVTAVGQPVGRILDKSGRGNHATQPTATARTILQIDGNGKNYLKPDGVDDGMVTGTITPGTDKVQIFAGLRKLSDAATGSVFELDLGLTGLNAFRLQWPTSAQNIGFASGGSASTQAVVSWQPSPVTAVVSAHGDIANDVNILRGNGAQLASNTSNQGTGSYGSKPIYLFRRAGTSQPFNGHFYGGIVRFGPSLDLAVIQQVESWMAGKTGVTI